MDSNYNSYMLSLALETKLLDPRKHDSNSAKFFIFMAITNEFESAELSPGAR